MREWEYKVWCWNGSIHGSYNLDVEKALNGFGKDGWELVNIVPQAVKDGGVNNNVLVFKKEKSSSY